MIQSKEEFVGPHVHIVGDIHELVCTRCKYLFAHRNDADGFAFWCRHPAQVGKSTAFQFCGFTPETPPWCPVKPKKP